MKGHIFAGILGTIMGNVIGVFIALHFFNGNDTPVEPVRVNPIITSTAECHEQVTKEIAFSKCIVHTALSAEDVQYCTRVANEASTLRN